MIVVADDFPSVFEGSPAHEEARTLGTVRVFTERGANDAQELIRRIGTAQVAINLRSYVHFTDAVFRACPDLRLISIWGTGTDNVDLEAAVRHGVTVCSTAGVNAITAAEHTIALMLAVARRIPAIDRDIRTGGWPREIPAQLHGKTLGVFGTGNVGGRVVKLGHAFGMKVLAWSSRGDAARIQAMGATESSKLEIVQHADFITLHVRLTPATRGFVGHDEFAAMKRDAILINTARGHLVDREALLEALTGGRIAGAGLDTFHDEPVQPDDPLLGLTNTILSPHIAGQSPEVRREGLLRVVTNVASFLNNTPTNVVARPS